jgi:hypothetical protein
MRLEIKTCLKKQKICIDIIFEMKCLMLFLKQNSEILEFVAPTDSQ